MRIRVAVIFAILIVILTICALLARRSRKAISASVAFLVASFIPPVMGNLILLCTDNQTFATFGYYLYFIGMDIIMYALLGFTFRYCNVKWLFKALPYIVYSLLIIDVVQFLLNPFIGYSFELEPTQVDFSTYYKLVPKPGQLYHRIVDYAIFGSIIVIFIYKMCSSLRIYIEKYLVILTAMIIGGAWQTFYIISGTPVDLSMLGLASIGLLIFYFAIYYRPMRLLDRMLASMASEMPESLFFFDLNGVCIWANENGRKLASLEENDYASAKESLEETFGSLEREEEEWTDNMKVDTIFGVRYYVLEMNTVPYTEEKNAGSFLSVRDITVEHLALQRETYTATHDLLTDLYTREHLFDTIEKTIREDQETNYLVVYTNVNNFKIINDVFGNTFGDCVLKAIADKIRLLMTDRCIYGRIVGDTFGMFIPEDDYDEKKFVETLSHFRVTAGSRSHNVLIHLGAYHVPHDPEMEAATMFDRARMAFSSIKDDYQILIKYYDDNMREKVLWDQNISSQLPGALKKRQIIPYLQPIVDTNGNPVGAEALVRWIHPEKGFMPPGLFVPVFEKNGMIAEIDKYMWRCACEILSRWKKEGRDYFISINISPKDFYFMDVVEEIENLVKEYGVETSKLRIEITETVMMTNTENSVAIIREFQQAGFIVEMDDFGSGYSSLNMLKDMPVDIIKIDMGFLRKSEADDRAKKILHNILNMTYDLGIVSLTEGVETGEQYKMLTDMGCRLFQGYHFAKPMPVEDFEKWTS